MELRKYTDQMFVFFIANGNCEHANDKYVHSIVGLSDLQPFILNLLGVFESNLLIITDVPKHIASD